MSIPWRLIVPATLVDDASSETTATTTTTVYDTALTHFSDAEQDLDGYRPPNMQNALAKMERYKAKLQECENELQAAEEQEAERKAIEEQERRQQAERIEDLMIRPVDDKGKFSVIYQPPQSGKTFQTLSGISSVQYLDNQLGRSLHVICAQNLCFS